MLEARTQVPSPRLAKAAPITQDPELVSVFAVIQNVLVPIVEQYRPQHGTGPLDGDRQEVVALEVVPREHAFLKALDIERKEVDDGRCA